MAPVWREPGEESIDLYPGLVVDDDRVTGSITFGCSRLPLWAVTADLVKGSGWESVERGWEQLPEYGWDAQRMADFLHDLLEARGEFARLLLVLADGQRTERESDDPRVQAWWEQDCSRQRVLEQLERCAAALRSDAS